MKIFKYMRDFGICGPRSNSTSTSIISDAWALNYNHSTSIAASCNTSPSCQVQSLSHGDWLRPHLIFAGWNAQRGPPSYKCAYTSAPIERHHVIVLLRESIFYFFLWVKLDSATANKASCTGRNGATSPVSRHEERFGRRFSRFDVATLPGLFIYATVWTGCQRTIMARRNKIHFTKSQISHFGWM